MKSRMVLLVGFLLLTLFSNFCLPQEKQDDKISSKKHQISKSLIMGIESENHGLKTSAIYFAGEYCCDRAVIPLLKVLHSDTSECARIVAALSLYKIGDERGLFAIKQASKFDDSKRVRRLCDKFYTAYIMKDYKDVQNIALKEK